MVHFSHAVGPRPSARERRRADATERIVDAAEARVLGGGVEALTMHGLARDLGYTVGALYRYFPSKEAVVLAVVARALDVLHADLVRSTARADAHLLRAPGLEPEDAALLRLRVALACYERFARRRPEPFRLLSRWLADTREVGPDSVEALVTPSLLAPTRHLRGLLEAAGAVGALQRGDARRRAVIAWGALHGVMQMHRFGRLGVPDFAATPLTPALVESLLVAWGADPARLAALTRHVQRVARSAD
jgi:AcrR family transcriptional regulator